MKMLGYHDHFAKCRFTSKNGLNGSKVIENLKKYAFFVSTVPGDNLTPAEMMMSMFGSGIQAYKSL